MNTWYVVAVLTLGFSIGCNKSSRTQGQEDSSIVFATVPADAPENWQEFMLLYGETDTVGDGKDAEKWEKLSSQSFKRSNGASTDTKLTITKGAGKSYTFAYIMVDGAGSDLVKTIPQHEDAEMTTFTAEVLNRCRPTLATLKAGANAIRVSGCDLTRPNTIVETEADEDADVDIRTDIQRPTESGPTLESLRFVRENGQLKVHVSHSPRNMVLGLKTYMELSTSNLEYSVAFSELNSKGGILNNTEFFLFGQLMHNGRKIAVNEAPAGLVFNINYIKLHDAYSKESVYDPSDSDDKLPKTRIPAKGYTL